MSKILRGLAAIVVTSLFTSVPVLAAQKGWIQNADGTWSYNHNGDFYKHTWLQINGQKWYHFNESGIMSTGWIKSNGEWYYLYSDGSMASNTVIDGYRLNASGAWVDDSATNAVEENKKVESANTAPGNGTMVINYDVVQIFRNNTVIEIWVLGSDGKWGMGKSLVTVPPKENGKNDNLQNGMPSSYTYTDYTYTSLQIAPQGHEYIIATTFKPRYRGVKIEIYKDNFYSSNGSDEKVVLYAKNI